MKLTALGVGSAFSLKNFHSNMLLETNGKRLLIDAGGDARRSYHAAGYGLKDLHAVYISHLHTDHMGGTEWLALATKYDPTFAHTDGSKRKLELYLESSLVRGLWDSVKAGCALQGEKASLASYFDVRACRKHTFEFAGTQFRLIQTVHYMDGTEIAPSYGLIWTAPNGQQVFLTTDTQFLPYLRQWYHSSDVILQDCETSKFPTDVHAHYTELVTLPESIKRKMWLYHYQDGDKPDATADGFAGYVRQGQQFDFA